jgi:hypothetical protein
MGSGLLSRDHAENLLLRGVVLGLSPINANLFLHVNFKSLSS